MTLSIERRIDHALENGDHHTLTEIAMIYKNHGNDEEGDRLLESAERMKRQQHDDEFAYDEERDNQN